MISIIESTTMAELANFENQINEKAVEGEYTNLYELIDGNGKTKPKLVNEEFIRQLKTKERPDFTNACLHALKTEEKENATSIFKGTATAIAINEQGQIMSFFSNNNSSPMHEIFVKAALEKATARLLLERTQRPGGIMHNEDFLKTQGFNKHEGAGVKSVTIDGQKCFIGVSGAMIKENFNKKVLGTNFAATETGIKEPEFRFAGFWDRLMAIRVGKHLEKPDTQPQMNFTKIPASLAHRTILD